MSRLAIIVTICVVVLFLGSWIFKGMQAQDAGVDNYLLRGFLITCSAFLTLAILSFLYKDNPIYKFAEHLYVGISAGYWMSQGFWSTIVGNLIPRLSQSLSGFFKQPYNAGEWMGGFFYTNWVFYVPVIFGVLLLMRLSSKYGWISRWALAFIVGTTAGLQFIRYMRSDFIEQISSTFVPLLVDWQGIGHFFSNLSLSATGQLVDDGVQLDHIPGCALRPDLFLLFEGAYRFVRESVAFRYLDTDGHIRRVVWLYGDGACIVVGWPDHVPLQRLVGNNELMISLPETEGE